MEGAPETFPANRLCQQCLKEKPATREFFHYNRKTADKCAKVCKECQGARVQKVKDRVLASRVNLVEKAVMKTIADVARSRTPGRIPHIAEIFERLMNLCGGAEGYAQKLMDDYDAADPGSIQRTQLHKLITAYAMKTTDAGAAKLPNEMKPTEQIDDELKELEIQRLRLLAESGEVRDAG